MVHSVGQVSVEIIFYIKITIHDFCRKLGYPMEVQGSTTLNKMTISKFHGIPWNMCHLKWRPPNSMESHGSQWFFYDFLFGDSRVPWNSVEYSLEVQGNRSQNDNLKVPWNCMELSDTSFGGTKVPWNSMECSMEFQGTKWYVIWRHQSSMEFHGIFHGTH